MLRWNPPQWGNEGRTTRTRHERNSHPGLPARHSGRGTASRTLAANSRRFVVFPFVFDSGEDLVDDSNEVKGTVSSIWLPLWDRATTFAGLSSLICDAQTRLPGKDARFSPDLTRARRAQGVDAGFPGWQEFRFKMNASRVPWACSSSATRRRYSDQRLLNSRTEITIACYRCDYMRQGSHDSLIPARRTIKLFELVSFAGVGNDSDWEGR